MRCILRRIICIFKHFHSALGIIKNNDTTADPEHKSSYDFDSEANLEGES